MTEIIIVAKKKAGWLSRVFFAPDTAILLITNVGNHDDGERIFLSDTHGDITDESEKYRRSTSRSCECCVTRPVTVRVLLWFDTCVLLWQCYR